MLGEAVQVEVPTLAGELPRLMPVVGEVTTVDQETRSHQARKESEVVSTAAKKATTKPTAPTPPKREVTESAKGDASSADRRNIRRPNARSPTSAGGVAKKAIWCAIVKSLRRPA